MGATAPGSSSHIAPGISIVDEKAPLLKPRPLGTQFKSPWTIREMDFPRLGQAEKVMAPHSSTLAWRIPWTEEPGVLQSMGSQRVGHNCSALEKEMATHSSILAREVLWTEEPGGPQSTGLQKSQTQLSD